MRLRMVRTMAAAVRATAFLCAASLFSALLGALPAPAQNAAPFYKDKTIRFIISTGVAGGYMEYARTLADHMGKYIPGHPGFIVQSMPGAGGLLATNYLYAIAPQDGTAMGMVHSTIPLAALFGNSGVRYDTLKFNWVGALDRAAGMCVVWAQSPVKTWADMLAHEVTVGSSGAGSQMEAYPRLLNKMFGARMKIIGGYKDGTDIYLAMERGEVEGRCGGQLAVIKSTRPEWLTQHKVRVPIVIAAKRHPEFPDTPTVMEFVTDEALRAQLDLITTSQSLDRPVLMPPNVPAERVTEIRDAFNKTMDDPAFRADIKKRNLTLDPVEWQEMTALLRKAFGSPPAVVAAARETMGSSK